MIEVRKHLDRGHINHRWLDSERSFPFIDYHDPALWGFLPWALFKFGTLTPEYPDICLDTEKRRIGATHPSAGPACLCTYRARARWH